MKQIINNNKNQHYDTKTQKLYNTFFIISFSFYKILSFIKIKNHLKNVINWIIVNNNYIYLK